MNERYIATADLGSSKIAVSVARVEGRDVQVIYYREIASDGIRYSTVFNPTRASEPLKAALKDAETELGISITELVIGLPRYSVKQETRSAGLERSEPQTCISAEEIDSLKEQALQSYPLGDEGKEEIFGAIAQSFSADDLIQGTENDVIGIPSENISGNFKIFVGSSRASSNIDILMQKLGITSVKKFFPPELTAAAVLTEQEMDNGVALVEMGAGVTSVTVYQRSVLRYFSSIPFGARNITMDIKYECGFTESLAENIKLAFGACMPDKLLTMGEKIIQINDDENGTCEQLPVKYLSEIITSRAREIINAVLYEIQRSGYADRLRSGIVLTGGGANLANVTNLVKEMSGYNVRLGFPRARNFSSDGIPEISDTGAAATVGMILAARENAAGVKRSAPQAAPAVDESKEEESYEGTGTVFDPGAGKEERRKDNDSTKKGHKSKITWGRKLGETIGGIFESSVGSLYDDMN